MTFTLNIEYFRQQLISVLSRRNFLVFLLGILARNFNSNSKSFFCTIEIRRHSNILHTSLHRSPRTFFRVLFCSFENNLKMVQYALDVLKDDPNRVKPFLTDIFSPVMGGIFGFGCMCFVNAATRRPLLSGLF